MFERYFSFKFADEHIEREFINVLNKHYVEVFQNLDFVPANYSVSWSDAINFTKSNSPFRQTFNSYLNHQKDVETLAETTSMVRSSAKTQQLGSGDFRTLIAKMNETVRLLKMEQINAKTAGSQRTDMWNIVWYTHLQTQ